MNSKKRHVELSQVFLYDGNIKKKIIQLLKSDNELKTILNILEIGVGSGKVTEYLLQAFPDKKYQGIEIDRELAEYTSRILNIKVINENYLKTKIKINNNTLVFSAIPYHLTTKFIEAFINNINTHQIKILVFIIQKEVFQRLIIGNNSIFYAFNHFFKFEKKLLIKKQCFKPIPKVDSIFSIWHLKENQKWIDNSKTFLEIIKVINNKKNKNIINNIKFKNRLDLLDFIDNEYLLYRFTKLNKEQQLFIINSIMKLLKQKKII